MKTRFGFLFVLLGGMLGSCGSASKSMASDDKSRLLDAMVAERSFRIESDWARPLTTNSVIQLGSARLLPAGSTAGRINLIGNDNYLEVRGDTVSAYLPYYGEQQMSRGYGGVNNAIEFKGVAEDFSLERNKKDSGYVMQFKIREDTESYNVNVQLFNSLGSVLMVRSSYRTPIKYDGEVNRIPEGKTQKMK